MRTLKQSLFWFFFILINFLLLTRIDVVYTATEISPENIFYNTKDVLKAKEELDILIGIMTIFNITILTNYTTYFIAKYIQRNRDRNKLLNTSEIK